MSDETGHASFAVKVRAARIARGLTPGDLAREAGVVRGTVLQAESGRDVRRSTAAALLRALPGLLPHDVVPGTIGRAPSAASGPWTLLRDAHGAVASVLRVIVEPSPDGAIRTTTEVRGLRFVAGEGRRDDLTALLRLAWQGSPSAVPDLDAAGRKRGRRPVVVADDSGTHRVDVVPRGRVRQVDYVRVTSRPRAPQESLYGASALECLAIGCCAAVDIPVERLEIRVGQRPPSGRQPVALAWLGPLVPEEGEPDFASFLHAAPEPVVRTTARGATPRVRRPLPGTTHALGARSPRARAPSRQAASGPGSLLRLGREAAGLTLRDLADRSGAGVMTLADAEAGRDVRVSTLAAVARALPGLSAWDLLGVSCDDTGREGAWAWQRDLYGCEIDEESKEVVVGDEGSAALIIRTRRLRRLRPESTGPLRVRVGFSLPVVQSSRATLEHVDAAPVRGCPDVRIGRVPSPDGRTAHRLIIPERSAASGISYARRLHHEGVFAMTSARAARRTGGDGPFVEGTSFAPFLPTRRLRLILRFPAGYWPEHVRAGAWALRALPAADDETALRRAHADGLKLVARASAGTVTLDVDHPLLGLKYGLSWRLP